jgi:hypothetical protein
MPIQRSDLASRHDFDASRARVGVALARLLFTKEGVLAFLSQYVSWNAWFGISVASMAGKVGRCRGVFLDASEPFRACADRAMHVASYFFDAARDEFDDRDTPFRDTHRTLAQAVLKGAAFHLGVGPAEADRLFRDPPWLQALHRRTETGYGRGTPEDAGGAFRAMGFHLGSEVLADQEFVLIQREMQRLRPELVTELSSTKVSLAGQEHNAWSWVEVHTHVEADHFEWAVQGVREAFRYSDPAQEAALREDVLRGFDDFADCHQEFFTRVGTTD